MHANSTVSRFPPQLPVKQIAVAAQALIDLLDALGGDDDLEPNGDELDGTCAEDEAGAEDHARVESGPGCGIGDPGEHSLQERPGKQPELRQSPVHEDREDDDPAEDDDPDGEHDGREPDHDVEIETWSHWLDHPPELHIGTRPGWNDGPEAA